MTTPSELSPDLRPVRYCPNCGQRVAQKAETCFMCGYDLHTGDRRQFSFPMREALLILVILGITYLWWTRSSDASEVTAQPAPTTSAAVAPSALADAPTLAATAPITASQAVTSSVAITTTAPAIPADTPTPITYTVTSGDTIEGIAERYGVSVQDLMNFNGLSSDLIQVDQTLNIPGGPLPAATDTPVPTAAPPEPTATPIVYFVANGDTIERIATRYDVTASALLSYNDLNSDLLQVGQRLVIPSGNTSSADAGTATPTATPKNAIYLVVVREGDTIESIAKQFSTSIDAIVSFDPDIENADSIIRPGQQVIVPVGTVTATLTVQAFSGPAATLVPTPTATPGPPHAAPQLMTPLDGASLNGGTILLQWLSVGTLAPDEVYVVRIVPDGRVREELTATTVGTSYRIPSDWLEQQGRRFSRFLWNVQVARGVSAVTGQAGSLLATSSPSRYRSFQWTPDTN